MRILRQSLLTVRGVLWHTPWAPPALWVAGLVLSCAVFGVAHYHVLREHRLRAITQQVDEFASLRIHQIEAWREERLADARVLMDMAPLMDDLGVPGMGPERVLRLKWFQGFSNGNIYRGVVSLDADLRPWPSQPMEVDLTEPVLRAGLLDMPSAQEPFELAPVASVNGDLTMDILVPLRKSPDTPVLGGVLMRIDYIRFVRSTLLAWARQTPSSEVSLWWNDGHIMRDLGSPMRSRFTLAPSMPGIPQASALLRRAARGDAAAVETVGRQGNTIIGSGRRVPGSNWILITETDMGAAMSPLKWESLMVGGSAGSLLLTVFAFGLSAHKRRSGRLKQQKALLAERLSLAMESDNDAVLLFNASLNIVEANRRAEELYGYTASELLRLHGNDLRDPGVEISIAERIALLDAGRGSIQESLHLRKDGSTFPVELSGRRVSLNGVGHYLVLVRDISERHAAQSALQTLALRNQILLQTASDGIHVIDTDGNFVEVNEAFVRLSGYTRAELLQMNITALDAGRPMDRFSERIATMLTRSACFETLNRRKDGSLVEVEVNATGVTLEGRRLLYASARDITERKRAEAAIADSNLRFRAIFEHVPVGIAIVQERAAQGRRTVEVNPEHVRISGVSADDSDRTAAFDEVSHPDDVVAKRIAAADYFAHRSDFFEMDKRYRRAGGGWTWARMTTRRVRDPASGDEMSLVTLVDLTSIKEAQAAIEESEGRYRGLFESSRDAILILGDPEWNYIGANPSAAAMFGYEHASQIVQQPWVLSPETQPDGRLSAEKGPELIDIALARGFHSFEWMHRRANGTDFLAQVTLTKMVREGRRVVQVVLRDITEARRAEIALKESELSLQAAQRIASIGSFTLDVASGVWACSPELNRIFGIDASYPHTINGWAGLVHPSERAQMLLYVSTDVLTRGNDFHREYRVVRPDDKVVRWVQGIAQVERGPDGTVVTLRGTIQDITERRSAEEALRQSRALLSAVNEGTPDCVYVKDRHGCYLMANSSTALFTGLDLDSIVGHDDTSLLSPEEARVVMERDRRIMATGTIHTFEETMTDAGGRKAVFLSTKGPVRNEAGEVIGLFGVARDITERKRTENELRRLSRAVEQATVSIVITDLKGNIEYVNPYFTTATGYTPSEVLGQNPRILGSGDTSRAAYREMWDTLCRGGTWRGEFFNRKKTGEPFTELALVSPVLDESGRIASFVAIKEDITERKAHEFQIARLSSLHQTLTRLGELMARERDRQTLIQATCETLGVAGFKLVWIGWQVPNGIEIRPAAKWGDVDGYVDHLRVTPGPETPAGRGPAARAFAEGNTTVVNDFLTDPEMAPWHDRARASGLRSAIGIPLRREGRPVGVLCVYSGAVGHFQSQEIELLTRAAENLDFTMDALDQEDRRRLAERDLRDSEARFRELFDLETDAIMLVDSRSGHILQANQAAAVTYGYSVEELQRSLAVRISDEPEATMALLGTLDKRIGEVIRVADCRHRKQDGTVFPVELGIRPFERGGRLLHVLVARDITEQVKAREQLQRFNAELENMVAARTDELAQRSREVHALLQAIPDMVVRLELDGNVLHCQSAQGDSALAGIKCDMALGPRPSEGVCPLRPIIEATGRNAISRRGPVVTETDITIGSDALALELRGAPSGDDQYVVFVRDITARRRLEIEMGLALAQEKSASEMKSRFIAVTSHEFRTPMSAALAAADLLTNHGDQLSAAQRQAMLERIDESMRRMSFMLDELLTLNRVSSGRTRAKLGTVDLRGLVEDIVEEMRLTDPDAHRFQIQSVGDSSGVASDAEILRHVVTNLVNNAIRYSPPRSIITVALIASGYKFALSVADKGMGIPEADHERLFSPFERGSNTTGIAGSGLGLSIAKRMAAMVGGHISFVSKEGQGSTFVAEFPLPPEVSA